MQTKETTEVSYVEMYGKAPYYGSNISVRMRIAEVLLRLPESVREFVLDECIFMLGPESRFAGFALKAPVPARALVTREFWLIALSQLEWRAGLPKIKRAMMEKSLEVCKKLGERRRKKLEFIIAHEIAHAYLNHQLSNLSPLDRELEADKFVRLWGFEIVEL